MDRAFDKINYTVLYATILSTSAGVAVKKKRSKRAEAGILPALNSSIFITRDVDHLSCIRRLQCGSDHDYNLGSTSRMERTLAIQAIPTQGHPMLRKTWGAL